MQWSSAGREGDDARANNLAKIHGAWLVWEKGDLLLLASISNPGGQWWPLHMHPRKTIVHVARDALLYSAISISLAAMIAWLFTDKLSDFDPGFNDRSIIWIVASAVVLGPIIETSMLVAVLGLAMHLSASRGFSIIFSAAVFAMFHAAFNPYWGLVVFPSFLIFSYVADKYSKQGLGWSFLSSLLVHVLQNGVATVFVHVGR